jgi:hypothetical protein
MRRIYAYFISLLFSLSAAGLDAQDTIYYPLKIRAGFDLVGPGIYIYDNDHLNLEGYLSFDKSEKMSIVLEGGYVDYKYSQYNYEYHSNGFFGRAGIDFNFLKPEISKGRYWAGLGLRYGLSIYDNETPMYDQDNYWGTFTSSIPLSSGTGHFIEVTPGFRTELLRNLSLGWTVRLKLLISGGGGKDLKPIYLPGYGNGGKNATIGISYYISWNIAYKTKRVITKPVEVEEPEETEEEGVILQTTGNM